MTGNVMTKVRRVEAAIADALVRAELAITGKARSEIQLQATQTLLEHALAERDAIAAAFNKYVQDVQAMGPRIETAIAKVLDAHPAAERELPAERVVVTRHDEQGRILEFVKIKDTAVISRKE